MELLSSLQERCGVRVPVSDDDWEVVPRAHILVRREGVLEDALKEARKTRFDPTKILKVSDDMSQSGKCGLQECNY